MKSLKSEHPAHEPINEDTTLNAPTAVDDETSKPKYGSKETFRSAEFTGADKQLTCFKGYSTKSTDQGEGRPRYGFCKKYGIDENSHPAD
eukprot:13928334-Ditylum_brightwellii.AAC.1